MLWFSEKVNQVHVENKKRNDNYCKFYIIVRSFKDFMFGSRRTWTLILTAFEKSGHKVFTKLLPDISSVTMY